MPSTILEKSERSDASELAGSPIRAEVNSPKIEQIERKLIGVRQYTPNTDLGSPRWNPDISIYCHSCQSLVPARDIVQHKRFHKELRRFHLEQAHCSSNGVTIDALNAARQRRLRQLEERYGGKEAVSSVAIHRVNEQYQFLKGFLFDERQGRIVLADKPTGAPPAYLVESSGLNCSVPFILAAGVARYHNRTFSKSMNAFIAYQDSFGADASKCYAGLFDGNFGDHAARVASQELHHFLLCELRRFDPRITSTRALNMAFNAEPMQSEIHRLRSANTNRGSTETANHEQHAMRTCEESLDNMAIEYARSRTSDLDWSAETEAQDADSSSNSSSISSNSEQPVEAWKQRMLSAFTKALHYVDGLLLRGQEKGNAVRWSGASAGAVLVSAEAQQEPADQHSQTLGWLHTANCGNISISLLRNNESHPLSELHTLRSSAERQRLQQQQQQLVQGVLAPTRGIGYHGDSRLKRSVIATPAYRCVPIDNDCQAVVMTTPSVNSVLSQAEIGQIVSTHLPVNRVTVHSDFSTETRRRLFRSPSQMAEDEEEEEEEGEWEEREEREEGAMSEFSERTLQGIESPAECDSPPPTTQSSASSSASAPVSVARGERQEGEEEVEEEEEQKREAASWSISVAKEAAETLAQATLLAGCHGDIGVVVLLLPAAMGPAWSLM